MMHCPQPRLGSGRLRVGAMMCDQRELQSLLKKAAAEKLGASVESNLRPEDLSRLNAGSQSMVDALRQAKEKLQARKAEVGEEAALAELDASIRSDGRAATARALLKARPRLWLLDRDGCINEDVGAPGVVRVADLRLLPGSAGAVRRLRLTGKVAIVTNQSARGKGLLSAAELDAIHEELRHQLATTARGGLVGRDQWDALYVCEEAGASPRKKPEPGMLAQAMAAFDCSPDETVMIGDSWSDVVAAHRAGCVGALLVTGHGASLGNVLAEQGVRLPVTLSVEEDSLAEAAKPTTDFLRMQRSVAHASCGAAADAIEAWIAERGDEEKDLIREALRSDVRVYADLAQAANELMEMATAFES